MQLSNLIDIALAYKHNIKINVKKLQFFDLLLIEKLFNKYYNPAIIKDKNNFFYRDKMPFPNETYNKNIELRNKILQKAFLINNINKLSENDLVIHIRSGDIFAERPHDKYVPPPLAYYTKQIAKYEYEKIYIICEDTINPVVNELLKLYKNAIWKKNTLEQDIRIILGATNIIFSVGTFIPSLMLLSNNNKYLYGECSACDNKELKEYYKIMSPWRNTKEQRDYILTYNYN
jgi:hypothetical protein